MGLACAECGSSLGRSDSLPGSEGGLVHSVVLCQAYVPDPNGRMHLDVYMESPANIALCFRCIEESIPEERKDALLKVYSAYEAEMFYVEQSRKEKGLMLRQREESRAAKAFEAWEGASKLVPRECMLTGKKVDGSEHFVFYPISRMHSESVNHYDAALEGKDYGEYSVRGHIERSITNFPLSFDAVKCDFPIVFNKLSEQMTHKPGFLTPVELKAELRTREIARNKIW